MSNLIAVKVYSTTNGIKSFDTYDDGFLASIVLPYGRVVSGEMMPLCVECYPEIYMRSSVSPVLCMSEIWVMTDGYYESFINNVNSWLKTNPKISFSAFLFKAVSDKLNEFVSDKKQGVDMLVIDVRKELFDE
jgi:hypothetical protein